MREAGLQGVSPRRPRSFTRSDPAADPAPDLVRRDFTANAANRLWVADISLVPTGEGPWWLATIRDAFSRRIVGWHTSERADADRACGQGVPCGFLAPAPAGRRPVTSRPT